MPAYMAYAEERATYPQFREMKCSEKECEKYLRKLQRHFKVPPIKVVFTSRSWGWAYPNIMTTIHWKPEYITLPKKTLRTWSGGRIELPKGGTSLGMVVHEFAHILATFRYKRHCNHDRRFKRQLKRSYTWAKRYLPKQA